jgi:hypothetical protein
LILNGANVPQNARRFSTPRLARMRKTIYSAGLAIDGLAGMNARPTLIDQPNK